MTDDVSFPTIEAAVRFLESVQYADTPIAGVDMTVRYDRSDPQPTTEPADEAEPEPEGVIDVPDVTEPMPADEAELYVGDDLYGGLYEDADADADSGRTEPAQPSGAATLSAYTDEGGAPAAPAQAQQSADAWHTVMEDPEAEGEVKQIHPHTRHHQMLTALARAYDADDTSGGFTSGDLVPYVDDDTANEGTVSSAMSVLWARGLVERTTAAPDSHCRHVYRPSLHGRAELDRLPAFDATNLPATTSATSGTDVRAGTGKHAALTAVAHLTRGDTDAWVVPPELDGEVLGLDQSGVSSTLNKLANNHDLLDQTDSTHHPLGNKYRINDAGHDYLQDHGLHPNVVEALNNADGIDVLRTDYYDDN